MRIIYLSFVLLLTACGSTKESGESVETVEEAVEENIQTEKPIQITAELGESGKSDPIKILAAEIKGNTLFLDVSYGGGCETHEFEFIGSTVVMKSLPPKRTVKLVHKAKGDACKAIINQRIEVDIKTLAYQQTAGSEINLLLSGYKDPLNYIYE